MHFGKGMENSHRAGFILLVGFSSLGHVHARCLVRHRIGRLDGALVDHQACIYLRHSLRADRRQCLLQPDPEFPRHQPVLFGNRRPALGIRSHLSDMDDAMLRSVGEDDVTESRMALPILLAIGWGSGIGGFGSPIGSSANLVAVSYIEKLTGHEFMYYDWVIRFLPLLAIVFFLNLIFLWLIPAPAKDLPGTRAYFREMYSKFGAMRRGEKIGLYLFILATALAFIRPLFASFLPAMKPAYVFLVIGMLMFFLHDENGKTMLDWQYAESHAMWGMIFLFASGLALGRLVIETGAIDRLAVIIVGFQLPPGLMTMAISCTFACFLSELSSNTAAASISIPVVTGITGVMGVNPIPYILGTIVAANCAYILPVSTRAIPVGYGLNPSLQIKYGIRLSILTCATTIIICTLFMNYSPLFNEL